MKYADKLDEIFKNYRKEDAQIVHKTIDTLCSKGIAKGTFQDYAILADIINYLSYFEYEVESCG